MQRQILLSASPPRPPICNLLIPSSSYLASTITFSNPSIRLPKLFFSSRPFCNLSIPLRFSSTPSRLICKFNNRNSAETFGIHDILVGNWTNRWSAKRGKEDMVSRLELGKLDERQKPEKRVNGIFWILLLNLGIYVADHVFQVRAVKALYLYHNWPAWYQFVTATFCHFNWKHLSSNLFFLYIFGKLVEEEEGNFGLWLSYILTGAGANLVSWLVLPRNAVSVGASGAVFGLFAISVLVKMSLDWRKILEVLILGQFVIEKVMEAAQASTGLAGGFRGGNALQNVNHIAHLSGALIGVALIWLVSRFPAQPSDTSTSAMQRRKD